MLNRLERADRAHSAMHPMVRWNMVYSKLYSLRAECHSLVLQERPQSVTVLSIGILAANIRISKGDLVVTIFMYHLLHLRVLFDAPPN